MILSGSMEIDETRQRTETRVDHHICGLVQLLQTGLCRRNNRDVGSMTAAKINVYTYIYIPKYMVVVQ